MYNINFGKNKKVKGLKILFFIAECAKRYQKFSATFDKKKC